MRQYTRRYADMNGGTYIVEGCDSGNCSRAFNVGYDEKGRDDGDNSAHGGQCEVIHLRRYGTCIYNTMRRLQRMTDPTQATYEALAYASRMY